MRRLNRTPLRNHVLTICFFSRSAFDLCFPNANPIEILHNASSRLIVGLPTFFCRGFQAILQILIWSGVENLAKDLGSLRSSRQKKFLEISLRNHRNLRKLAIVETDKLRHRLRYLPRLCDRLSLVRKCQNCIRFLHRHSFPARLRPQILGISSYCVGTSLTGKYKLHKRVRCGFRIFAPKHSCVAHLPACLPVKRKCDRIKNRRLSRSRIPADQVKTSPSKFCKIKFCPPRIRSKRTDNQILRSQSHLPPSKRIFSSCS